ncbi:hypothetical protein KW795_02985, partial [Candidatus Microgenomates bacterium]|nr:hypothetical protein [Candidatus Microgenomates bacterium]
EREQIWPQNGQKQLKPIVNNGQTLIKFIVMPKFFQKFFASFFVFVIIFTSIGSTFVSQAKAADSPWYAPSPGEWYVKTYDSSVSPSEIFGERYTAAQVTWIVYSLLSLPYTIVLGPDLASCIVKSTPSSILDATQPLDNIVELGACIPAAKQRVDKFLIGYVNNANNKTSFLAALTTRREPSAISYLSDIASNFHLISEAKAQDTGFGFTALSPILNAWKISRNVTYSLMIVVVVIMSFMIMFRVKLSPQTAITVQSSLVKIASALILITFSYAIAGLLVDLMYIVYGILSIAISNIRPDHNTINAFNNLTGNGSILLLLGASLSLSFAFLLSMLLIGAAIGSVTFGLGFIVCLIIGVIVFLAVLILTIKTMWVLLKAYAMTLLLTIAAPFQILLGVLIPSLGFSTWLRSFVSNLAIFVTASLLLYLSQAFVLTGLEMFGKTNVGSAVSQAGSAINGNWPPLLGGGGTIVTSILLIGVGFVLFVTIPKSAEFVQALIKGGQFNYGAAIGEATNPFGLRSVAQQAATTGATRYVGGQIETRLGKLFGREAVTERSGVRNPPPQG